MADTTMQTICFFVRGSEELQFVKWRMFSERFTKPLLGTSTAWSWFRDVWCSSFPLVTFSCLKALSLWKYLQLVARQCLDQNLQFSKAAFRDKKAFGHPPVRSPSNLTSHDFDYPNLCTFHWPTDLYLSRVKLPLFIFTQKCGDTWAKISLIFVICVITSAGGDLPKHANLTDQNWWRPTPFAERKQEELSAKGVGLHQFLSGETGVFWQIPSPFEFE